MTLIYANKHSQAKLAAQKLGLAPGSFHWLCEPTQLYGLGAGVVVVRLPDTFQEDTSNLEQAQRDAMQFNVRAAQHRGLQVVDLNLDLLMGVPPEKARR